MAAMADILKILILNLMGGIGCYGDSELLNWFSSNIQDGGHGGNLETLQTSDSDLLKAI